MAVGKSPQKSPRPPGGAQGAGKKRGSRKRRGGVQAGKAGGMMKSIACRAGEAEKKLRSGILDRLRTADMKKAALGAIPYLAFFYFADKEVWLYRHCTGSTMIQKLVNLLLYFGLAFKDPLPSLFWQDLLAGAAGAAALRAAVWARRKNAKKYRQGVEYGSARWGTAKDIAPFIDPVFENNIILTKTEFLTMDSRPKNWKYARNKNVIVIGGSGSGKTRYFCKPNLMQASRNSKISYVVTDPKGTTLIEVGHAFVRAKYRIKIFNTINFRKSMHYNRATCSPPKMRRTALFSFSSVN